MSTYAFWNNKGGTGKTSLAFQTICRYAEQHPTERILAIDTCPQANLSELLLGGLTHGGSENLLQRQGLTPRCTIGGYFQLRLPSPFNPPAVASEDFITTPQNYNPAIPRNLDLICGDPLLELQGNAINTLANTQIPGTNTWVAIIDWLRDLLGRLNDPYDTVFIDSNPSFSIYTQIALSAADFLILPVTADDSSRRAIQNAFSLVYGLRLPSEIYAQHAFATRLREAGRQLARVHVIAKNRLTQYMGPASAYAAVLSAIDEDVRSLLRSSPDIFNFADVRDGVVNVRDFQTTGVVAFARGCPFYSMPSGRLDIGGQRVRVNDEYKRNCIDAIDALVNKL
jgi:cellulose biosynthesis protein BcsQ